MQSLEGQFKTLYSSFEHYNSHIIVFEYSLNLSGESATLLQPKYL